MIGQFSCDVITLAVRCPKHLSVGFCTFRVIIREGNKGRQHGREVRALDLKSVGRGFKFHSDH